MNIGGEFMDFVMQNLPIIICAVIGIILLVVEFFMPGFGLPGIAGLLLLAASVVLTWMEHGAYAGLVATVVVLSLGSAAVIIFLRSATKGRISRSPLMLHDNLSTDEAADMHKYLHRTGITQTVLRPAGIALIDGDRVNVVSGGEYIQSGAAIRVEEVEGSRVLVRKI